MFTEEIKKVTNENIKKAELKRQEFLDFFDNNGIKYAANNLSKPYLNELSPG